MPNRVIRQDIDRGGLRRTSEGDELNWAYRVAGDFTEVTVLSAVDDTTGLTIPAVGSSHPDDPDLVVESVDPDRVDFSPGFGPVFDVRVTWRKTTSSGGEEVVQPEYEVDFEEYTELVDHDLEGRPFVNTVGDPIRGGWNDTKIQIAIRIYRTEYFDVQVAAELLRRVNAEPMRVLGYTIDKEQMICWSYKPTQRQRIGASALRVKTVLEFKIRDGHKPWQAKFNNVGMNGYTESGTYGPLVAASCKDPISEPIPLDGSSGNYGKPLFGTYLIYPKRVAAARTPFEVAAFLDSTYPEVRPTETSPPFYQLFFKVKNTADFRGLVPGITAGIE